MAQHHHWTQKKLLALKKLANDMGLKWSIGLTDSWTRTAVTSFLWSDEWAAEFVAAEKKKGRKEKVF